MTMVGIMDREMRGGCFGRDHRHLNPSGIVPKGPDISWT
jgi:hypothetical protein